MYVFVVSRFMHANDYNYVLVIAQPECAALGHYIAPVQYMACCTRAPAITNLLPNDVKLV